MGALPAVAKVVRVDHFHTFGTDPDVQVRDFFGYSGTLSLADAITWCALFATAWNSNMIPNLSNQFRHVNTELTDLSSNTAPQVSNSTGSVGTDTQVALPQGTAMVLKKHITRRYRGGHPRMYMAGFGYTRLATPDTWDPTFLTSYVNSYVTYLNAVSTTAPAGIGTINHVNISYFAGFTNHTYPSGRVKAIPTPRATPLVDNIASVSGNPIVASQRRRNEQP